MINFWILFFNFFLANLLLIQVGSHCVRLHHNICCHPDLHWHDHRCARLCAACAREAGTFARDELFPGAGHNSVRIRWPSRLVGWLCLMPINVVANWNLFNEFANGQNAESVIDCNFHILSLFQISGFPTIQHDMKKPKEFTKASILAFTSFQFQVFNTRMITSNKYFTPSLLCAVLTVLYMPVCLLAYFTYGNSLRESVMNSIQHVWIQHVCDVFK